MELKELLHSLEERLAQHDNNRKEIQSQLEEIYSRFTKEADSLEEKINGEIEKSFNEKEKQIFDFIEKLNNHEEENGDLDSIMQQAREELSHWQQYEIKINEEEENFADQYNLEITEVENEDLNFEDENGIRIIVTKLQENLNKVHHSVASAQDQLAQIITERKNRENEIKKIINEELEKSFPQEDSRIQEAVNMIKMNEEITEELIRKARLTLLINQKYSLSINENVYKLVVKREISNFEERKSSDVIASFTDKGEISISFSFFNDDEIEFLKTENDFSFKVTIKLWEKDKSEEEDPEIITKKIQCWRSINLFLWTILSKYNILYDNEN